MPEYEYELYHHGVKGMKWGIRRLRKKISRGLKKARKKASDVAQAKKAEKEAKKKASRSVKELTDSELKERAARLRLEKDVLDLERQISSFTPKQASTGEKFAKTFNDTVVPALTKVGKDYLEKALREATGLNDKDVDPFKMLKDEEKKLDLEAKIANHKKQITLADDFYADRKAKAEKKEKQNQSSESSKKKQKAVESGKKMVEDTFSKSISELEKERSKNRPPIDMDMELRDLLWF